MVPWTLAKSLAPKKNQLTSTTEETTTTTGSKERVYQRYYHMFRKGELEDLIIKAGGAIVESGYDRDNWWCIASSALTV